MIPNEVLTEELLQQAAKQYAEGIIASLPSPKECNHKFSDAFEEKMQSLIRGIGTKSCSVAIQDSVICK